MTNTDNSTRVQSAIHELTDKIVNLKNKILFNERSIIDSVTMNHILGYEFQTDQLHSIDTYKPWEMILSDTDLMNSNNLEVKIGESIVYFLVDGILKNVTDFNSSYDITALIQLCPNLSEFWRWHPFTNTNAHVLRLAHNCPKLTKIFIRGCNDLTDDSIEEITKCPMLTSIDIKFCNNLTNESLVFIANNCPNLTAFQMSYNPHITNEYVVNLTEKCPLLNSCICNSCENLTDRSVTAILQNCPNIRIINLQKCLEITNGNIEEVDGSSRVYL
jgi:hypothetical protein